MFRTGLQEYLWHVWETITEDSQWVVISIGKLSVIRIHLKSNQDSGIQAIADEISSAVSGVLSTDGKLLKVSDQ